MAQLAARRSHNPKVVSSILTYRRGKGEGLKEVWYQVVDSAACFTFVFFV